MTTSPVLNQPSSVQRSAPRRRVVVRRRDPRPAHLELAHRLAVPRARILASPRARISTNGIGRPCIARYVELPSSRQSADLLARSAETVPTGLISVMPQPCVTCEAVALRERLDHRPRRAPSRRRSSCGCARGPTGPGSASSGWRIPIQIVGTPAVTVTFSCCEVLEQAHRIEVRPGEDLLRRRSSCEEYGKPHAFAWNIGTTGSSDVVARPIPRRADSRVTRACDRDRAVRVDGRPSAARWCRSCNTSAAARSSDVAVRERRLVGVASSSS